MSDQIKKVIGNYLAVYILKERVKCGFNFLKFQCKNGSSVDNRQEIEVTYQLGKKGGNFEKSERCLIRVVLQRDTSDGSGSNEFAVYLTVLPGMERILEGYAHAWEHHIPKFFEKSIPYKKHLFLEVIEGDIHFNNELDYDNVKAVLKKTAQFHAASAVYLKKFDHDGIVSKNSPLVFDSEVESRIKDAIDSIKANLPEFEEIVTKISSYVETFRERITDLLVNRRSQFKVIALGDLTKQNLMSYCENGKADFLFTTFKNCFVGSCGYDLNFFFNTSLQLNDLALHRHDLLRFYYQHLTATLNILECPVPSWQTILDEVRELELVGIYALLCEMPFCCEEKDFQKGCILVQSTDSYELLDSFKEKYEVLLQKERVKEVLKYGLDRLNELRFWDNSADHNAEPKDKPEDIFEFVSLENCKDLIE